MNRQEFETQVQVEGLTGYEYFIGEEVSGLTDHIVMTQRGGTWLTFLTNERATIEENTITIYDSFSDALEGLLNKLRQADRLRKLLDELKTQI